MRSIAAAVLLLLAPLPSAAQTYPPAATYESLMNLRFYPATGGFMVDNLWLVFPPSAEAPAEFVVRRAGGEPAAAMALRLNRTDWPVFMRMESQGVPVMTIGQPGEYVMVVRVNGQDVTTLPFTLRDVSSGDAFNPGKTWYLEGPWSRLAFLSAENDDPEKQLSANLWTSLQEIPGAGPNDRKNATVHLMRGAAELATAQLVVGWNTWQSTRHLLRQPAQRNFPLKLGSLTDGSYSLVFKVEGRTLRTWPVRVQGGDIVRMARNQLGAAPATGFISPRIIGRVGNNDEMLDVWWVEAAP